MQAPADHLGAGVLPYPDHWGCGMRVIHQPQQTLMDREALAQWTKRSPRVIREHCPVSRYGYRGTALYDAEECAELLDKVPRRDRSPGKRTKTFPLEVVETDDLAAYMVDLHNQALDAAEQTRR